MPRDIDEFELSDDARRLYDWMIAAFTMDINAAMADAEKYGAWPTRWPRDRVQKAHVELKTAGVLSAEAPDLESAARHATKKSPARLQREIDEALARRPHPTAAGRSHAVRKASSKHSDLIFRNALDTRRVRIFRRDSGRWDYDVFAKGRSDVETYSAEAGDDFATRAAAKWHALENTDATIEINPATVTEGW